MALQTLRRLKSGLHSGICFGRLGPCFREFASDVSRNLAFFSRLDLKGPTVRLYFCLNKNVGKACFHCSGLLRPLHSQVWNWSLVIRNFSVRDDADCLKFVFPCACQVIRNFTETYDWMPILASNLLLMSILIPRHLNSRRPIFYGEIISKILQCLFDRPS